MYPSSACLWNIGEVFGQYGPGEESGCDGAVIDRCCDMVREYTPVWYQPQLLPSRLQPFVTPGCPARVKQRCLCVRRGRFYRDKLCLFESEGMSHTGIQCLPQSVHPPRSPRGLGMKQLLYSLLQCMVTSKRNSLNEKT